MEPSDIMETAGFEDNSLFIMARIEGHSGAVITQTSLSSIACRVYDDTGTEVAAPSIAIGSTVYNTLQTTDSRWTKDAIGYNFAFTVPGTSFPTGGESYLIKFTFTPTTGDAFNFAVKHSAVDLPGQ